MQIYAKIWTYLHTNVKFNKYVKCDKLHIERATIPQQYGAV